MEINSFLKETEENSIDVGGNASPFKFDGLKPYLEHKRFVFIGESSHCVKEYSTAKTSLIQFLHEKLDFHVLAFESELGDCSIGNHFAADLTPLQWMSGSIGRVWHNEYNLELFRYMKDKRTSKPLHLTGIDVQQSTGKHFSQFMESYLTEALVQTFLEFDKLAEEILSDDRLFKRRRLKNKLDELDCLGNQLIKNVRKRPCDDKKRHQIVVRSLENRLEYAKANVQLGFSDLFQFRDKMMAENLKFLSEEIYPDKKFIIWAHNMHIRKKSSVSRFSPYKSMMEHLDDHMKENSFVLALYANEGMVGDYNGNAFPVKKPTQKNLEWLLNYSPYQNSFISTECKWGENKWRVFEGGGMRNTITPVQQYDGILFFKQINPAQRMKET
ncbi:erythromycin esterase family protein [Paenibacillus ehimensis]|uniref:erythromycin esterase family protein n=1 Tax=Paenibacillus ehimensis TaxID=79264 RepID=UPI000FD798B5|nr:erythromycin esterase family protein [Paenibacillus ehimensis]